jgi:hypothetical protein
MTSFFQIQGLFSEITLPSDSERLYVSEWASKRLSMETVARNGRRKIFPLKFSVIPVLQNFML